MRRWMEESTAEDAATTFFMGVFRRQRRLPRWSLIDLIGALFTFDTIASERERERREIVFCLCWCCCACVKLSMCCVEGDEGNFKSRFGLTVTSSFGTEPTFLPFVFAFGLLIGNCCLLLRVWLSCLSSIFLGLPFFSTLNISNIRENNLYVFIDNVI